MVGKRHPGRKTQPSLFLEKRHAHLGPLDVFSKLHLFYAWICLFWLPRYDLDLPVLNLRDPGFPLHRRK